MPCSGVQQMHPLQGCPIRGNHMFDAIQQKSESDSQLVKLFFDAREYAQVYVLAKGRDKRVVTAWANWRP